jgi:hypothetical protein
MAKAFKHIGKMKNTGSKVLVVFRTLPGESDKTLILPVSTLPDSYHDSIMTMLETDQAQEAFEFGEMMFIRHFPDGRPMLQAMQVDGRLVKVSTTDVMMTPAVNTEIPLSELNVLIAEQMNCAIDDLCTFVQGGEQRKLDKKPTEVKVEETVVIPPVTQAAVNEVLTDGDIAKSYRSQADALYKEAARLRKEADSLDPPKKKAPSSKAIETENA